MLLDVVAEIGLCGVGAGDEHFGDPRHRIAYLAEEFMLAANTAAMLARVVDMCPDLLRDDLRSVELEDLRRVVIDPGDGMETSA